jgi:hypothetical protein
VFSAVGNIGKMAEESAAAKIAIQEVSSYQMPVARKKTCTPPYPQMNAEPF